MSAHRRVGGFIASAYAAAGVTTAFLPLWLTDRGASAGAVGTILGAASLLRVAAVPGWGALADRAGRPPLALAAGAAALLAACLPAAQGVPALLLLVGLQGAAASALSPLADALTLALAAEGRLAYGRTRAWGSASYMVATAAAGPALAAAGSWLVPWLLAAGYGVAALLARALPRPAHAPHAAAADPGVLRLRAFRLTLLASALIQGSHAAYYGFAPILWRAAGLGDTAIGLLIAEGIVMEIVLFVWGGALTARLGPARLTGLAAVACLLRWPVLALSTDVGVLAAAQVLHAGSFAMQHLSAMQMLARTVPPRRAAGAQALHAALGFSAPVGVLIWLTGLVFAQAGGAVFWGMAALGGAALLLVRPLARAVGRESGEGRVGV